MNFEQILTHCGNFGVYQYLLMALFGIVNLITSMHYFTQTIITFTPQHFCRQENFENTTSNVLSELNKDNKAEVCFIKQNENGTDNNGNFTKCQQWIYKYELGFESISTELNWVCDDAYKLAVGQSFFFVGSVIGTISIGLIADNYGRVPAFLMSSLAGGFGDFLTSFTNSVWMFAFARLIAGLSVDTMFYIMYIVVFEYLDSKWRTFGLNIVLTVFYTVGLVSTPWIAVWLGTWRLYLMATSLPTLIVILYPFIICESAQWYITRNRLGDAIKCLKYVAKINRKEVPENYYKEFEDYYKQKNSQDKEHEKSQDNFLNLFMKPRLRKIVIILLIKSMFITICYDVMGRNVEGLGISPFYLFSLSSSVYMPAGFTIILLQNWIGRRGAACSALLTGCLLTAFTAYFIRQQGSSHNNVELLAVLMCLCRYTSIVAYDGDTQHTAELLPTSIRGQSLANVHVVGYAFSFLGSYIIFLGLHYYRPLPLIILSVMMLLATSCSLKLPETLNKKLPETLAELEEFGKDDNWFEFPCFRPNIFSYKLRISK